MPHQPGRRKSFQAWLAVLPLCAAASLAGCCSTEPETRSGPGPQPAASAESAVLSAQTASQQNPTPENFLNLSLQYCQTGRFRECISAAQEALRLRPDYAEAYNNIAVGYYSLKEWDPAIQAARQAIRLKPDFELAKNNLLYALDQKRLASGSKP